MVIYEFVYDDFDICRENFINLSFREVVLVFSEFFISFLMILKIDVIIWEFLSKWIVFFGSLWSNCFGLVILKVEFVWLCKLKVS